MSAPESPGAVLSRHPGHLRVELTGDPVTLRTGVLVTVLDALDEAASDDHCRAVVISSRAPQFCLGMPLRPESAHGWGGGSESGSETLCWQVFQRLTTTPVVTIGVVEASAAGGGVALAAACDLVVAGPGARFRLPEVVLGLVPGMALPVIARRTGTQAATRLALTAREIGADEAAALSLVDAHGPEPEKLLRSVLHTLNGTDRTAVGLVKSARGQLFPLTDELGAQACALLRDRLDDPSVQERMSRFRDEGLLA